MRVIPRLYAITMAVAVLTTLAAALYRCAVRDLRPAKLSPEMFDRYVGYYAFSNGYMVRMERKQGRLLAHAPEYAPAELLPASETSFFLKGSSVRWTFHRDAVGKVDFLTEHSGKRESKATRLRSIGPYTESPLSLFWLMQIAACESLGTISLEERISKSAAHLRWSRIKERLGA